MAYWLDQGALCAEKVCAVTGRGAPTSPGSGLALATYSPGTALRAVGRRRRAVQGQIRRRPGGLGRFIHVSAPRFDETGQRRSGEGAPSVTGNSKYSIRHYSPIPARTGGVQ